MPRGCSKASRDLIVPWCLCLGDFGWLNMWDLMDLPPSNIKWLRQLGKINHWILGSPIIRQSHLEFDFCSEEITMKWWSGRGRSKLFISHGVSLYNQKGIPTNAADIPSDGTADRLEMLTEIHPSSPSKLSRTILNAAHKYQKWLCFKTISIETLNIKIHFRYIRVIQSSW